MTPITGEARRVRSVEVRAADPTAASNAIEDLYNDVVDVVLARGAFARGPLETAGDWLDRDDSDPGWTRPNQRMPVEDIQILGTTTPATPTYQAPRGGSLDTYLQDAEHHHGDADRVFAETLNPTEEIRRVLSRYAGGRPVDVPVAADGRRYLPYTLRRLVDGKQIGIHHDYHYPLPLYSELAPHLDTRTLVSWVFTLRTPQAGGDLFVYAATSNAPDVPKMPNGFQYDLAAIEARYDSARITPDVGDLFLLASGRCLHRVERISGPHARVTMGGFLALDTAGTRVYFWS
jgi:hypothetical protein